MREYETFGGLAPDRAVSKHMRSDRSYNVIRELQGTLGSTVSTSFFISGEPEAQGRLTGE